jgi:hypothetical protein
MNKNIKYMLSGIAVGAILATAVPTIAKNTQESIDVTYRDIKLCVDGVNVDTSSAEPFIYNGTTYLPVRSVAEALGKPTNWDGTTGTVYIGNYADSNGSSTFDLLPYSSTFFESYVNGDSFMSCGVKRSNGFTLENNSVERPANATYNLDGKYNSITFDVAHVDNTYVSDATIRVYLDGKIVKEVEIGGEDLPKKVTVPLNGALQMKIELGLQSGCPKYGFFDVKLS